MCDVDQRTSSELHGLQRREPFAAALVERLSPGDEGLRGYRPRSRRAHGQWFLALARGEHSGRRQRARDRRRFRGSDDLPNGVLQLRNDAGTWGYVGAAPPAGDPAHRYVHTVHALDVERLDVEANSSAAIVGFNLRFHAIARAQIVPIFGS